MKNSQQLTGLVFCWLASWGHAQEKPRVAFEGELRQWHKVTLTLDGPAANELDSAPNPFLDYAFDVVFEHASGTPRYAVPGYFGADGMAAETSASQGNQWRAHVTPDKPGTWGYTVRFRHGVHVAVGKEGESLEPFDGLQGTFDVAASDKTRPDLRAQGRLTYVAKNHLQFAGSEEFFFKVGADAPETLLAYCDFDGTESWNPEAPLKTWQPHLPDWREGDPTWQGGKGKGLIGAINYLADQGMNAFSFLTYNAGGDGDNVWPFIQRDDKLHYDCSKLDQWAIVFDHGQSRGMYLHFKLSESENSGARKKDNVAMDAGELGVERKLYLREMIARFGYALALNWNLGEENTQTVEQQRDMAEFIATTDPYGHLIVTHTGGRWSAHQRVYPKLLGDRSELTGVSLQTRHVIDTHRFVLHWVERSNEFGRPWVVANDEQDEGSTGTPPDPGFEGYVQEQGPDIHAIRKHALWATIMAGGAGIEYYFGYLHPENDILCENWRSRQRTWDYARIAAGFLSEESVPFWEMHNANALVGNADHEPTQYCLAKENELYLIYLPEGGTCEIDLRSAKGAYEVRWFDPRGGGSLRKGTQPMLKAGNVSSIGNAPREPQQDWVVLLRRISKAN